MKMNRKFVLLLIPLLMLPMAGFGVAHWTDSVKKDYYMHAGTVKTEIVWFHIEGTNTYDVDCDNVIYGDELIIEEIQEYDDELEEWETKKLSIYVDPIYPSWYLDLEMIIHNKGRLAIKLEEPILRWTGPQDNMLDDIDTPDAYMGADGIPVFFQYLWYYSIWDEDFQTWITVEPTTFHVKPSHVVRVKQYIHFIAQEYPELQCHWLDLHVEIPIIHFEGVEWASLPNGPYIPPPNTP